MPGRSERGWIGQPLRRKEDHRLLAGRGSFVDDLDRPGLLHASFVRSPLASGLITRVDLEPALGVDGVVAAFDGPALGVRGLTAVLNRPEFTPTEMPILAGDRVRHVLEPVAVVVAEDPYAAEDGAEAVSVDYEPLPATSAISRSLGAGAPLVHGQLSDNAFIDLVMFDDPELDEVFERAAVVIAASFSSGRLSALPLEGRACLAEWSARDEQLVVFASTQVPHQLRTAAAGCLGLSEGRVRVIAPDVGGGFGLKCVAGREEIAVAAVASRLRRPVRWVEDRRENLAASFHGHEQELDAAAAFDAHGHLLGLEVDIRCDVGAYSAFPFTSGVEPLMAAGELPGPYRLRHYRARARGVATNKAPSAPYRGVSRPQITLVMERLMDKAARRLRLDPAEIRRRNLIGPGEFPYTGVTGIVYDPGSYRESLELCVRRLEEEGWFAAREAATAQGRLVGVGLASFSERTAYGTSTFAGRRMGVTPGYDVAHVRMDPSGTVVVTSGTCGHGQGHETTFAQIVADQLGLHPEQVQLRQGDTELASYGWGTFASRSVAIGGSAAKIAAVRVAERLREIAAHLLEASPDDVELREGAASVRGAPEVTMTIPQLARAAHLEGHRLPPELRGGLEASGSYDPPGTFSNATHGVVVEIDAATGKVSILRYVVVEDCGVIINPRIVDGQVRGGVAQGIAAALYERHHYDEDGQLLTASLVDYLAPTVAEVPDVEILHLETPSAFSETGAKGMGEGGTIGAPAAIANAVNDALSGTGVELDSIPLLPEQILAALDGRGAPAPGMVPPPSSGVPGAVEGGRP